MPTLGCALEYKYASFEDTGSRMVLYRTSCRRTRLSPEVTVEVAAACAAPDYHSIVISETIKEKLARQPFEPFVIRSSSGHGYKVSSPDLIVLMKTKVFVAEPRSDRAATVSYLHIAAIEETGYGHGNGHSKSSRRRRG